MDLTFLENEICYVLRGLRAPSCGTGAARTTQPTTNQQAPAEQRRDNSTRLEREDRARDKIRATQPSGQTDTYVWYNSDSASAGALARAWGTPPSPTRRFGRGCSPTPDSSNNNEDNQPPCGTARIRGRRAHAVRGHQQCTDCARSVAREWTCPSDRLGTTVPLSGHEVQHAERPPISLSLSLSLSHSLTK